MLIERQPIYLVLGYDLKISVLVNEPAFDRQVDMIVAAFKNDPLCVVLGKTAEARDAPEP